MSPAVSSAWPELRLDAWRATYATLHMWTQIIGKICLALTPRTNHFWNIAFQVTARGLATPTLPATRLVSKWLKVATGLVSDSP